MCVVPNITDGMEPVPPAAKISKDFLFKLESGHYNLTKRRGPSRQLASMLNKKKVIVVMPAYNAAKTLRQTHAEVIAQEMVDEVVVVDDGSHDETIAIARTLARTSVHLHSRNLGYGANQKTCYAIALEEIGRAACRG